MSQSNPFGNTNIFPNAGSVNIFGNLSNNIFGNEEIASSDIFENDESETDDIFENDSQDVELFAWIDFNDDSEYSENTEHSQIESEILHILENVLSNPSTPEGVMIAHVLNSFLDLLD